MTVIHPLRHIPYLTERQLYNLVPILTFPGCPSPQVPRVIEGYRAMLREHLLYTRQSDVSL